MSIAPVTLDDLTWTDLTDAARARLPALSEGRWTLHAPVDPGITLVELYAWLLEQRLFWMDGRPDALTAGALALLGVRANGPAVASTVLCFSSNATVLVPAGTLIGPRDGNPGICFATDQATLVLPLIATPGSDVRPLVGLRGGDGELGTELLAGRMVPLFDGTAEMTITLRLKDKIPLVPTGEITLLLLLDQTGVPAEWSPEAVAGVAPPAKLSWWYRGAGGARLPITGVTDGTGGLRRSGIVRFTPPADWQAVNIGTDVVTYDLMARVDDAAFPAPPRLSGIWPNVAAARHRHVVSSSRPVQWLKLPGQTIPLDASQSPPIADGSQVVFKEADGSSHVWRPTDDFGRHGRADRVFTIDRDAGVLRFGDGRNGRIPRLLYPDSPSPVQLTIAVGGGVDGNIAAGANWEQRGGGACPPARNVVAATGGADPETLAAASERAASGLRRVQRAVLARDYEILACETPGVAIARAHAAPGYLSAFPRSPVPGAVTVFIVPRAARDPGPAALRGALIPDPGALAAVAAWIDAARLLGAEVVIAPPIYVPVMLTVDVTAQGTAGTVRLAITARLATFLDPLTGGDMNTGWPFGEDLRPSALLRQAQDAVGGQAEVTRIAITLPGTTPPQVDKDCHDVSIGPHALPALRKVDVRVARAPEAAGGLT